jgi:hypothetical protein
MPSFIEFEDESGNIESLSDILVRLARAKASRMDLPPQIDPIPEWVSAGVNLLGYDFSLPGKALLAMLAKSVGPGEDFLDKYPVNQGEVLWIANDEADYADVQKLISEYSDVVTVRPGWINWRQQVRPNGEGCIKHIEDYKDKHKDLRMVILGDFECVKCKEHIWYSHLWELYTDKSIPGELGHITRQKIITNTEAGSLRELKKCAVRLGVSIVVSHQLSTKNNAVLSPTSLRSRHNELRIHQRAQSGEHLLKVMRYGEFTKKEEVLIYNDERRQFSPRELKEGEYEPNEVGKICIDLAWEKPKGQKISPEAIEKITSEEGKFIKKLNKNYIPASTARYQMQELSKKEKGCWLEKSKHSHLYEANREKHKNWAPYR